MNFREICIIVYAILVQKIVETICLVRFFAQIWPTGNARLANGKIVNNVYAMNEENRIEEITDIFRLVYDIFGNRDDLININKFLNYSRINNPTTLTIRYDYKYLVISSETSYTIKKTDIAKPTDVALKTGETSNGCILVDDLDITEEKNSNYKDNKE